MHVIVIEESIVQSNRVNVTNAEYNNSIHLHSPRNVISPPCRSVAVEDIS
eukprot:m.169282 g.169282  ORF g.169282 m.169282 type:complete len:50 (+) comp13478_c1_seq2:3178-3327(+)